MEAKKKDKEGRKDEGERANPAVTVLVVRG